MLAEVARLEGDDKKVDKILVQGNTVRREGEIELGERDWGEQREINKRKRKIQEGVDPDLEEKLKKKSRRKMLKKAKKERLKAKQKSEAQTGSG